MQLITDIEKNRKLIESSIKKYGYGPEHNYWNLKYYEDNGTKNAFFNQNGMGIMCINYSGIWEMLPGILAPKAKRFEVLKNFLDHLLFKKDAKKVFVDVPKEFRDKIKEIKKYKIPKYYRTFYFPIYNLKKWDENMPGKKWKKLRNLKNKLYSEHKIKFIPCNDIEKEKLKGIFEEWKKKRKAKDSIWQPQFYDNIIENDFKGIENAKTIVVDGVPSTISGGWKIPNSNDYYSALGLLNYKFDGIGEVSIIHELNFLKKKNYDYVNFGQSEKSLLDFKKKFYPERIDIDILFSVSKNK